MEARLQRAVPQVPAVQAVLAVVEVPPVLAALPRAQGTAVVLHPRAVQQEVLLPVAQAQALILRAAQAQVALALAEVPPVPEALPKAPGTAVVPAVLQKALLWAVRVPVKLLLKPKA